MTTAQEYSMTDIRALVNDDFIKVDQLIDQQIETQVELTKMICKHIIQSGGKRLRPVLVLLAAKALHYQGDKHILVAAIIEFIHTATLLHDDVIDNSSMRRGKHTANQIWGNAASVLVGDFLYSRSFQMLSLVKDLRISACLADMTNAISEGEILQLTQLNRSEITQEEYMHIIHCKTAKLFEAATTTAAIMSDHCTPQQRAALTAYGAHLGNAFQLVDDALDYAGNPDVLGKNIGDDLAEGKPTLPLIYAYHHSTPNNRVLIKNALEKGDIDNLPQILEAIKETKALEYTFNLARRESQLAIDQLSHLEDSPYRQAMESLARFAVQRTY